MAKREVSPQRQVLYYAGMGLAAVGVLLFISVFFSVAMNFGHFGDSPGSGFLRAAIGMVMMFIGRGMMTVGRAGVAGSGLLLNPQRARRDIEPWSRMTGGMVSDALDEAGINLGNQDQISADLPFDEKLRRLHKLHEEGILSNAEYQQEKQEILRQS